MEKQFYIILFTLGFLLLCIQSINLQARLPFQQYCLYHGYPVQKHYIVTPDQYFLEFYRIQKKGTTIQKLDTVVYLQHGFSDSSDTWIINQQKLAPGFVLANQGYDVWFGNSRGNKYSNHDLNKRNDFWEFSFDQMAEYDLPGAFKYIVEKTGKKIHYIGHSQGTLIMFAALSQRIEIVQNNLLSFSAFGPVAYINHQKSKLLNALKTPLLEKALYLSGVKSLLLAPKTLQRQLSMICTVDQYLCSSVLFQISQMNNTVNSLDRLPVIMGHFPAGVSLRNVRHFDQYLINGGVFCKYDFGKKINLKVYGTQTPPKYDLSKVRVPVHLFVGQYDRLADKEDATRLFNQLVNSPNKTMKLLKYGHATFIWGKQTEHLDDAIKIIESTKNSNLNRN